MSDSIYLDNQATTPTDPRVRDALLPFLEANAVGNPHSEHFAGRRAAAAVEEARAEVAALIGARPQEIIFTSGATEANNLALQGVTRSSNRRGNHIITWFDDYADLNVPLQRRERRARPGDHRADNDRLPRQQHALQARDRLPTVLVTLVLTR